MSVCDKFELFGHVHAAMMIRVLFLPFFLDSLLVTVKNVSKFACLASPHVTETGFRNRGNFCLWKRETWALESRIPITIQRAKKVLSDSPGLVDFAIGLVISVLNLPDGQVLFFGEIQITEGL